jgi:hypothetical protein
MLTLTTRARAVLTAAWRCLPRSRLRAVVRQVRLDDLGAVNGLYDPDAATITLNRRLFEAPHPGAVILIDWRGQCPPQDTPAVSRALHTTIHELAHALGQGTGLDRRHGPLRRTAARLDPGAVTVAPSPWHLVCERLQSQITRRGLCR